MLPNFQYKTKSAKSYIENQNFTQQEKNTILIPQREQQEAESDWKGTWNPAT